MEGLGKRNRRESDSSSSEESRQRHDTSSD